MSTLHSSVKRNNEIPEEHERKFFPDLSKFLFTPNLYRKKFIAQGYLEDSLRTRIRHEYNDKGIHVYTQTRKSGKGISRSEDEQTISKELFDTMWNAVQYSLTKSRYLIPFGDIVAEYNIFHGNLEGYVQIEVEFDNHKDAVTFIPPEWFGLEVTDDSRHDNYSLAKHGLQGIL